jgi:WD40 repeat protein
LILLLPFLYLSVFLLSAHTHTLTTLTPHHTTPHHHNRTGEDEDCLLASLENHQGAINGLHFNPHPESSHLLASGGSDCEVYVTTLERPDLPTVFVPAPAPNNSKHTADITKVAWNTQVAHILASAAQNGSTFIWDLRQKKAWCELRDPAGMSLYT